MSSDGGDDELWLDDTVDNQAMFTGQYGRTYSFYSVARDHVGHEETVPATPDTTTTVAYEAPEAHDDEYFAVENATLFVSPAEGVLANDVGQSMQAELVQSTQHGVLDLRDDGSFDYTPDANFNREDSFQYLATDGTSNSNTATVMIIVETEYSWHNGARPVNVNGDEYVSPLDALFVVNTLNSEGGRILPTDRPRPLSPPFYDVNRDGMVSPIDALWVVNYLNAVGAGEAEGASVSKPRTPAIFAPTPELTAADIASTSMDAGDVPRGLAANDASPAATPWIGFPATESLHEASLWAADGAKWADEDLEELLALLAGDIESRWEECSRV